MPGIPKTIERTVQLWRFRDPLCQQISIRELNTAEKQKSVICVDQYSDKYWDSTGNKRRFLRIQALIRFVADESNVESVDEEGANAEWNAAIAKFHEKWDIEGKPCALSRLS